MGFTHGVGREAPTFTLASHDGNEVGLRGSRGNWLTLLLFYNPGVPAAERRLTALSDAAGQFWGRRCQILAISPASAEAQAELAERLPRLAFPLLVDDGAEVTRMYGALNPRIGDVGAWLGVLVDRAGKIVWEGEDEDACRPDRILSVLEDVVR